MATEILRVTVSMVNMFICLFPCGSDMSTESQADEGTVQSLNGSSCGCVEAGYCHVNDLFPLPGFLIT